MKKVFVFCLIAMLSMMIMAACGNGGDAPAAPAATPAAPAPVADGQAAADPQDIPDSWLVPERTTIRVATSIAPNWAHPNDGMFWSWLEEYTNVSVDWTVFFNDEAPEQFALMMAAQDLPDAFIGQIVAFGGGDAAILLYGMELGVFLPLNDLIQSYAPNFLRRGLAENPNLLNLLTAPDGNIYSLPHISGGEIRVHNHTAINQTWLDNLGLEVPRTIEEVEQVLIAFRDGDPNGDGGNVIPLSFMFNCWGAADHGHWFAPFGAPLSPNYILVKNNRVTFQGAEEYFRDGARWLASLYAQGLIDLEVFTYDEAMYRARAASDPPVFGIWSSWNPANDSGPNHDHYTTWLPPVRGPGGASVLWEEVVGFQRNNFQITNVAPDPVLLMRWIDVFFQDLYTSLNAAWGPGPGEDLAWFIDENDQIQWTNPRPDEFIRGMNELPFAPSITGFELAARQAPPLTPNLKLNFINEVQRPYAQNFLDGTWRRWPVTFMLPHEADEISFIEADMIPFTDRMLARWIAGEGDVDAEWDQFLRDLDAYGLQRWLTIRQNVFDRFLAAG